MVQLSGYRESSWCRTPHLVQLQACLKQDDELQQQEKGCSSSGDLKVDAKYGPFEAKP
jgi:hypothetical protein